VFLAIQFPFCDVRPFLECPTHRLPRPFSFWGLPGEPYRMRVPDPENEFIRGSGPIRRRVKGGLASWPGEEIFCSAAHAVRLPSRLRARPLGRFGHALSLTCAFRRFHSDGLSVSRVEIGFSVAEGQEGNYLFPFNAPDSSALLAEVLSLPVRIPLGAGEFVASELGACGKALANHYLSATTQHVNGAPAPAESWWVTAGPPALLVEYSADELGALPRHARAVKAIEGLSDQLSHYGVRRGGRTYSAWFLRLDEEERLDHYLSADEFNTLRRLRLNLFRIHAELQSLATVLRLVADQRIAPRARSEASAILHFYLQDALKLLRKKARYGLEQSKILNTALSAHEYISPGEWATLLAQLSTLDVRKNLQRNIEALAPPPGQDWGEQPSASGDNPWFFYKPTIRTGHTIHFGDHSTVTGDLVVAQRIQDSFNKTVSADVDPALKKALENLTAVVTTLCAHLLVDEARGAARHLNMLAEEALSERPARKWYEFSAEGLMEAAKSVADLTGSVATAVAAVLELLP